MRFTILLVLFTLSAGLVIGAGASHSSYPRLDGDQVATAVYIVGAALCLGLAGVMLALERLIVQREQVKAAVVVEASK